MLVLGPKQYTNTEMSPYECTVEVSQFKLLVLGPRQYTNTEMSPNQCMVEVSQINASIRTKAVYQYWNESIRMYGWSFYD